MTNLYGQKPLLELRKNKTKHFHDWLSKLYLDWLARQPLTGVGGPLWESIRVDRKQLLG